MNDEFGFKKKKSDWEVNEEIIKKLIEVDELIQEAPTILQEKKGRIKTLIRDARNLYQDGNIADSAKKFRQLATYLKDIQFNIEKKGTFDERNKLNDLTGKEWLRHSKSWLIVDGKSTDFNQEIDNHPGTYPPDLAKHFISFFTKKDEWVFDPFMGIGSTIQASKDLKRNCWGVELNPKYAEYAQRRVTKKDKISLDSFLNVEQNIDKNTYRVVNGDSRDTVKFWKELKFPKVKFVMTSPPYWNMLENSRGGVESSMKKRVKEGLDQKYSEDDRDLGNIDLYDAYIQDMTKLFADLKEMLEENAYLVIVLQNVRPEDGIMKPIAWDFANSLAKEYTLRQEFIWLQDQKFMGIWGYPTQYVSNVHHHYCLVFQNTKDE